MGRLILTRHGFGFDWWVLVRACAPLRPRDSQVRAGPAPISKARCGIHIWTNYYPNR